MKVTDDFGDAGIGFRLRFMQYKTNSFVSCIHGAGSRGFTATDSMNTSALNETGMPG